MKTLILGLGNPILSDDGVGLHVAALLKGKIDGTDVLTTPMVSLEILDLLLGYDRIFLIDALSTGDNETGALRKLTDEGGTLHLFSSHGVNFFELLELGKRLGLKMPAVGAVYGIEIGRETAFGNRLSHEISRRIQTITDAIIEDIRFQLNFREQCLTRQKNPRI